ncbi:hypothetical protein EJ05DRAFT_491761 [Pseudovirgaria hyperparasitica]|uniref:Anaphase-promoting complex subunit 2 n=1 Tax=Pseudovirgaria hyperparasitica TaxID=470096 RepID=A0A6A6WDE4_9PEZI|nr:uncharacterized protein EJ05DRAFT_491761 [Pseudovirgaria hyperparasitica]KAF2760848.1 hypothetical protein EJ05DRAFT_491761 [Pseudovirgaria hyperparasitica]
MKIRSHFTITLQPKVQSMLATSIECKRAWEVLENIAQSYGRARTSYTQSFTDGLTQMIKQEARTETDVQNMAKDAVRRFQRELESLFVQAIPAKRFSKTLSYVLFDAGCKLFRLHMNAPNFSIHSTETGDVKRRLVQLLKGLQMVGLGGDAAHRSFAHAMDKLLSEFVVSHYMKVDWYGKLSVTAKLKEWIKDGFGQLVLLVMECLTDSTTTVKLTFGMAEITSWQKMAIERLGRARADNLFDYIVNWDQSIGAILDLKEYLTTNSERAHLVVSFTGQLYRRLLRPGTTTTHILDIYIYVIRAFKELDPKGVLLERVALPIRRYLKDRTDTAKIIVSSLLADIQDEDGNHVDPGGDISIEIATEMLKPISSTANDHDDDLNWGDLNWTPEPVDASAEYKSSRANDVISYLLTLFDPGDFITELKNILGEHLLTNSDSSFDKEIRLLELFKLRLGDSQMQACDVMLRDVVDSKRLNTTISSSRPTKPPIRAHVLSSFFWPPLRDDTFTIPATVAEAQAIYAAGFEAIKDMRKLHWLPALGKVTVELELQDREVSVDCTTWQASVIHAFQRSSSEPQRVGGVARSVQQLEDHLAMDEALVRNALAFWVGERVLAPHPDTPDTYVVLERLTSAARTTRAEVEAAKEEAAMEAPGGGGVVTANDLLDRNRSLYETFVVGMLTNQGGMTRARILMMLKMAVPGGFPGGAEDVGTVLEGLREAGKVDSTGADVWAVKKG